MSSSDYSSSSDASSCYSSSSNSSSGYSSSSNESSGYSSSSDADDRLYDANSNFSFDLSDDDDFDSAVEDDETPRYCRTENGSATYKSTGNPSLDFFFHIVPDTPPESLTHRLKLAWRHDPLMALKLICQLRGVRGTGKSDKEGFYAAALWLHKNHPKTLACNVKAFAEFGYFKDLPEILYRLLEGLDIRKDVKEERSERKESRRMGMRVVTKKGRVCFVNEFMKKKQQKRQRNIKATKSSVPREERVLAEMNRVELEKEKARNLRNEKRTTKERKAMERLESDANYRFLHDRISELFAEYLISDLQFLNSGELSKISFAAKWCPSLDSSYDKSTLLCESIARRVFPRESYPEYKEIEDAHYAYRVRDRLRKECLVPLRKALELPEVYMSSNRWELLPYNRVTSVAMKTYKKIFRKHDEERFNEYLGSVKRGEAKIAAGALLPHEIIASFNHKYYYYYNYNYGYEDEDDDGVDYEVAELQWRRMVEDLSKKGKLRDCLAICDVSGSMEGTPMDVSVALGLLVSEMSEDPWKGKLITFSSNPQLHKIEGDDLRSKIKFVKQMEWGMSTDFQKVFDQILQVAVNGKLKDDQMIKRVFVFSDMEFNEASGNKWETDYQAIQRKFRKNGYMSVPEIVFWNLRDSLSTPVTGAQKGVALVSGFSKNLLSLFLEGAEVELHSVSVMQSAISGEEYNELAVVD